MNFQHLFDRFKAKRDNPDTPGKGGLPVQRVTVGSDMNLMAGLSGQPFSYVNPKKFPVQMYDVLMDLTLSNPDLRQAVGHIVQLGNTGHLLSVAGGTDAAIEGAVKRIRDQADVIFPWSAGVDGLINAFFAQIARMGATCVEWVPQANMKGIDKAFIIPISEIRWCVRPDGMGYYPVQVPKHFLGETTGPQAMIRLDVPTIHYANIEHLEGTPYAIPPMIAALEPIAIQRLMVKNIHNIVKKLGIMGLMTYKVEPPKPKPGEKEEVYQQRCLTYLANITEQLKGSFENGIAAGFKGAFEFDVAGVTGDARGIAEIFKMNEEQLFSAIGADPAMHGRTYSTTETYASVVYSKMISLLANIQRAVAHNLEFGWGLDLRLAGLPADIGVTFKASQALSNLQEAQAEMVEIANASALYQEGVIDQAEKARRLGYSTPAEKEPRLDPNSQDKNIQQRTGGGTDNTPSEKTTKKKQPKESQSVRFEFNQSMKQYYALTEVNYLDLNGTTMPVTLADKKDRSQGDASAHAKFRRYLQGSPDPDGCC